MRTRLGLALALAFLAIVATQAGIGSEPAAVVAAELTQDPALGDLTIEPATPDGKVSAEAALEVVKHMFGGMFEVTKADAYLVTLTDPATLRGNAPIDHRAVWLVRVSNVDIPISIPVGADGPGKDPGSLASGYIYVDATSGEFLTARFQTK